MRFLAVTSLILIIAPLLIGLPWGGHLRHTAAVFPIGFFLELVLFQLIAFPAGYFGISFRLTCYVFAALLVALSLISLIYCIRHRVSSFMKPKMPEKWEWVYLILFLGLLAVQIVLAVRMDLTEMSYDDNWYVTWANDTVNMDRMFVISDATGLASRFNVHRAMQTTLVFPSMLTVLSKVPVVTVEHTVLQVFCIILAYSVYAYMAGVLFERRDHQLIFLVVMAMLYIAGYYSHYSTTFRLLGPNYQGKAVLAVSLTPLVFTLLFQKLDEPYDRTLSFLLVLLSIAATACSLIGTVTIIVNVGIPVVLSLFGRQRSWKRLRYLFWTGIMPAFYAGIYLLYRFSV